MRVGNQCLALMIVALLGLSGCAGNPTPRQWRQPAAVAQRSPRGGWIRVETLGASSDRSGARRFIDGELIAIDQDVVRVLTVTGLQTVPWASARRVTIVGYGTTIRALAIWAVAGGISTLSHGMFLIFTAPTWAVTGIIAVRTEGRAGLLDVDRARGFARFPQGLPAGFDPRSLGALTPPDSR